MVTLALATLVIGTSGSVVLRAQEHQRVNSPKAVHEQTARHSQDVAKALATVGTPETPFDFINFGVSGPVVVLQGFTITDVLKKDAQAHVQKLTWVTHVVNEVEYLKIGPNVRRIRQQTLAKLQEMVPQAFPENHADIRIKVTVKGDITLVGVISPNDKVRLEAAIEQIKHFALVNSVTNQVVERTN
jgi:osmotically-inducible protein OsmY